jgi:hypothetical protein
MDLFKSVTVLSSDQDIVLPFLTSRFDQDGIQVCRPERPAHRDPNRIIGGVAGTIAEIPRDVRRCFLKTLTPVFAGSGRAPQALGAGHGVETFIP